jgi:hypothetical protein
MSQTTLPRVIQQGIEVNTVRPELLQVPVPDNNITEGDTVHKAAIREGVYALHACPHRHVVI